MAGGNTNTITIAELAGVTSLSNQAILGGDRNETVDNFGWVAGDVDLNGGTNAFFNRSSATFYSGGVLDLNGGPFQNAGLLSPGGPGVIMTTELNGSFEQTSTGTYAVDINMGDARADLVNATGPAILGGKVRPDISANPITGTQLVTILQATGVTNDNASVIDKSALADYALLFDTNNVMLSATVDFAPDGLKKQQGVGQALNKVFNGGGPSSLEDLGVALIRLPSVSDVDNAYYQLAGGDYSALGISEFYSQERFKEDLITCPIGGTAAVVTPAVVEPLKVGMAYAEPLVARPASYQDESQCIWARSQVAQP